MSRIKLVRIRMLAWAAGVAIGVAPAVPAVAQQTQPAPGNSAIGPEQLRDFQLEPRQRIVTQPRPVPTPQAPPTAQPQPERPSQPQAQPAPTQQPRATTLVPRAPVTAAPSTRPEATGPIGPAEPQIAPPEVTELAPTAPLAPTPAPTVPAAGPAAESGGRERSDGLPLWAYLLGGLALGGIGYLFLRRRRAAERRAIALPVAAMPVTQPQAPRAPRPDPVPRPWLEIELVAERTTADPEESVVEFELTIRNSGGSPARNVKLQAKLICSTPSQDKDIGDFHRKKPGEHRTLDIPDIPAGQELRLKGQVDIKRADIKVTRVDDRLLFIPLVAVNAFYEWGAARSGQTSKSFLVGREKPEPADKMAPFRLDLGPRVYRTVGQRPYKVERRV